MIVHTIVLTRQYINTCLILLAIPGWNRTELLNFIGHHGMSLIVLDVLSLAS